MAQTCRVCKDPQRLYIEQALVAGTPLRDVERQFLVSRSALSRHRPHLSIAVQQVAEIRDAARVATLLEDVRAGEERVDRLYREAERILAGALVDKDRSGAVQAVKAASSVLAQARGFMELRGELTQELGRDRTMPSFAIQILCPQAATSTDQLPRIQFIADVSQETDLMPEIGVLQR